MRELVAASIVTKIDKGSKGLLNKSRFKIFGVDLWYKIRGRSQTIVRLRNSNQVPPSAGPFALRPSLRDLPWRAADWLRSLQVFAGVCMYSFSSFDWLRSLQESSVYWANSLERV